MTLSPSTGCCCASRASRHRARPVGSIACAPRRTDLPALAIAGVECKVGSSLVERVGAYRFRDARDAATTYLARLAAYHVAPTTGGCQAGTEGDAAWMPGDRTSGAERVTIDGSGPWVTGRSGCFLDENGTANVRLTCGSTYLGVLGSAADLAALYHWAWSAPGGTPRAGDPPGICQAGA